MSKAPERIWAEPGMPGYLDEPNGLYTVEYVRADRIEELEDKLARAEYLLVDAMVQLENGKIKTRRNRAYLIGKFIAELKGQAELAKLANPLMVSNTESTQTLIAGEENEK